jgi:hypothetical protein
MTWLILKYLVLYPVCLVIGHDWKFMGNGYKCCGRCTALQRWEL